MSTSIEMANAVLDKPQPRINTLNEKDLHADLKAWCAQPGDQMEVCLVGFIVDIIQDHMLVEIQTQNISAIRRQLTDIITRHRVRLVYPIAQSKWIIKQPGNEKSPLPKLRDESSRRV